MPENIAPDAVQKILTAHNISFRASDIQNGRQFRFENGAILSTYDAGLSTYDSGKIVWQGKSTTTAERVKELLERNPPYFEVTARDIAQMDKLRGHQQGINCLWT